VSPRFRRASGGEIVAGFEAVEAQVLRSFVRQVRELLEPDDQDDSGQPVDPLEELTGLHAGPGPTRPTDPALARLLPDAYGPGGEVAESGEQVTPEETDERNSAEFRRLTEHDLRSGKMADAEGLLGSLPKSGGRVVLEEEQAHQWLRTLNDVRLALGTRLGVSEDSTQEFDRLPADDPDSTAYELYVWLSILQESLLSALVG
jgi:hypothetical protein